MSVVHHTSPVAPNYHPLPVTLATGEGSWVTDVDGRRYLDLLCGYSALNFGHRHPRLVAAAKAQLDRLTLTARAFGNDRLEPFCERLGALAGKALVLPMNTGAEAVETGIKTARRWAHEVKGVPTDQAEIVVAAGNFHGRTTTIVSFSDDALARDGFGPYTPGFVTVPYGDLPALEAALTPRTAAVLLEPIQGEAGVIIPPDGYLAGVRAACTAADVLLVADEIQSGLGRTGRTFACDHEGVVPDLYLLGKALGGGILPVSACVGDADVLGVMTAGRHGSTFGGNPLACAVGIEVVELLREGSPQAAATRLGPVLAGALQALVDDGLLAGFRARGLWAGIDVPAGRGSGRDVCERLLLRGVLAKDTHGSTLRLAPPLTISDEDLAFGLDALRAALADG